MERERGSKVIAIIALCVGVVGLSLGFAAFSSNLVIKSSATVEANAGDFSIIFANAAAGTTEGGATAGTPSVTSSKVTNSEGEQVDASTIGNLSATFTKPGQKVTYVFDAKNAGKYIAYLNSIKFTNATGKETFKACTASTGTTQTLVDAACSDISLTVTLHGKNYTTTVADINTDSAANFDNSIAIGDAETVTVVIEYVLKGTEENPTNTLSDGDFTVSFGDIQLEYGSVD